MRRAALLCCAWPALFGWPPVGAASEPPALPDDVRAAARISVAPLTVEAARAAVIRFQAAVAAGDAAGVAALTRFPLRVNDAAGTRKIPHARAFRDELATLFDVALRTRVASQPFAAMPAGYRGLMFDGGRLWLQPVCLRPRRDGGCRDADHALRLVAINVPAPEAPAR
jgi:hypothetical protein